MPNPPTVYDVAAASGVSIATVSRVLRSPDAVRESTRRRVLDAVQRLGYVPSASARGLAARRTNVVGLFLPSHDPGPRPLPIATDDRVPFVTDTAENGSLFYDEVLRGAELEAGRHGLGLMLAGSGDVEELASRVDGLAVLAGTVEGDVLAQVARRIPVVVLAGDGSGFDHVGVANEAGMRALTDHVRERHAPRSVLYVDGPAGSQDAADRRRGLALDADVLPGDFTRESGRRIAASLGALPAAIVCANDEMALGVLDELGDRVPGECLVTGFDGIAAGRHSRPTLTTVHQPMGELGRAAIHAIRQRLRDPSALPQTLRLAVSVVLRESCP